MVLLLLVVDGIFFPNFFYFCTRSLNHCNNLDISSNLWVVQGGWVMADTHHVVQGLPTRVTKVCRHRQLVHYSNTDSQHVNSSFFCSGSFPLVAASEFLLLWVSFAVVRCVQEELLHSDGTGFSISCCMIMTDTGEVSNTQHGGLVVVGAPWWGASSTAACCCWAPLPLAAAGWLSAAVSATVCSVSAGCLSLGVSPLVTGTPMWWWPE